MSSALKPGAVYEHPGDGNRRLVVLTNERYNESTGRPVVCPLVLTEEVLWPPDAALLRTLTPSPGFIAYPLRYWVPGAVLSLFVGDVEPTPLEYALQVVLEGHRR